MKGHRRHEPRSGNKRAEPTHWGPVAEWYDELVGEKGSEYHQYVVNPGVLRMLGAGEGKGTKGRVLDLACGQGVLCRLLAREGWQVVGVDAAPQLIDVAQDRADAEKLPGEYVVADATALAPGPVGGGGLTPSSFDAVTLVLAVQNMTPLSPIWRASHELLKPGGVLIVVLMHPCFRVPQHSNWHWNDKTSTQSRTVSTYLSSVKIEIQTHPGAAAFGQAGGQEKTLHFHRPLQAYLNTLGGAGLPVEHVEEWPSHKRSQPGPKAAELDRSRREIPMFLALRARKVAAP